LQRNLTVQKQFGQNVFTVAYVANLSRHLNYALNVNQPAPSGTAVTPTYLRAATLPNITNITLYGTGGAGAYNAAQVIFERRYSKGLTVNANYVFARNLTNIAEAAIGSAGTGTVVNNRGYDWGNADIGFKHKFTMRANYELPFGKSATGWRKQIESGWQINTIAFWQSGQPFTVLDGQNLINLPNTTSDRPNWIPGQPCTVPNGGLNNFINLNAFQQQRIGNPGAEGRISATDRTGAAWTSLSLEIFRSPRNTGCPSAPRHSTPPTRRTSRFPISPSAAGRPAASRRASRPTPAPSARSRRLTSASRHA